jgi:hypothetical protein
LVQLAVEILRLSGPLSPGDLSKAFKASAEPDKKHIEKFLREELTKLGCDEHGEPTGFPPGRQAASDGKQKLPPPDRPPGLSR